ncbi:MAG: HIT family protein, partial [Actinobacteria bacterium]|nr:HIT family protein [Actinomycetota bacterium]
MAAWSSPFLDVPPEDWIAENESAFAIRDRFPVSPGHALVITRRLVPDWWGASPQEQLDLMALVEIVRDDLEQMTPRPDGFNVGF